MHLATERSVLDRVLKLDTIYYGYISDVEFLDLIQIAFASVKIISLFSCAIKGMDYHALKVYNCSALIPDKSLLCRR